MATGSRGLTQAGHPRTDKSEGIEDIFRGTVVAEALKNHFDERIPRTIAGMIAAVHPVFDTEAFLRDALDGFEPLGLMDRGRHIGRTLQRHLPGNYPDALAILLRSAGDRPRRTAGDGGMASFLYLPHVSFVAEFGLDHFGPSMEALHFLTRRFTAEFSVRPFIERYEDPSLAILRQWAMDPDAHVRRLVSEGTRPRLPWASHLRRFQEDPTPVLELLELLKDDPEPFVRRSVANNLNDIGRDHADLLVQVAQRWIVDASDQRRDLVRHALRSLVKSGHPGALEVLGFGGDLADIRIEEVRITPQRAARGDRVAIEFVIRSLASRDQRLLVDFRVFFVRAGGRTTPKVFKLKAVDLPAGGTASFRGGVSLADLTTRRHYPGMHRVEALVNGRAELLGAFILMD